MERKKLGKIREDYEKGLVMGEIIYLSKHSWNCDWYWGFGYIGNKDLHTHFNTTFLDEATTDINKIFSETKISQNTWWLLRDLFIQAYALKEAPGVYRNGGYQTTEKGITDIIQNKAMEERLNKDLRIVLDKIWELV